MIINWKPSESTVRPNAIDTTSSPTTVYLCRNIHEVQRTEDEETVTMYEYETAKLTVEEYAEYKADLRLADIEDVLADIIGGGEV